ncbi:MAG: hypothetical protein QM708_01460 [Propioniciclava sp.]|uniref:hypothetical protein n=1 Tax=Propioniciclava sp. TaxID=2038686 RepID=UPI0039E5681E
MIAVLVLICGVALVGWYAWQATRARDRWPAVLAASESLAIAFLVAAVGDWGAVPWWVWWIVVSAPLAAAAVVAWRWADLGSGRPRWRWPSLAVCIALIAVCSGVSLLPPG